MTTTRHNYLLGIDAGTSVVKAALFRPDGSEVLSVAQRTTLYTPHPAWAEASMEETWDKTADAIRAVLHQGDIDPDQIAAVGVTGNMVGAWLIDAQGEPIRNAILWCDGRTQPLIDRLSIEKPNFMTHIFDTSGGIMQQGCTLPVLRWLAENEPDVLARAAHVLCCKDWINFKLTGEIHIDPTEASVMPGDTRQRGYSADMFEWLGVSDYRHLFPAIQPSVSIIGSVHQAAAAQTGLRAGTPVITGAGDVPASVLGAGATEPGMACSLLGTNFLNCLVVDQPLFTPRNIGVLFCLPTAYWLRATINVSGTTSLDWAIDQFALLEKTSATTTGALFGAIESLVAQSPPGANGIVYLPYLSAQGIVAPFAEPTARANLFGLTNEHTRGDLLRAIYEGLAYSIRDGYDVLAMPVDEIRLTGGAAKSAFFCQLIADVTGKTVIVPGGSEFGAKGAALLAAIGIGWFASVAEAAAATTSEFRVYDSNTALAQAYSSAYITYCELRDTLRHVWKHHAQRTNAETQPSLG